MSTDVTRMSELLVGLTNVRLLDVTETHGGDRLEVTIETSDQRPFCRTCGTRAMIKERPTVRLVDLPSFGRPVRLRFRKHRFGCCGTWTEQRDDIAAARQVLTRRAGLWATFQVGKTGRAVADVAAELGCDWHTVNDTVIAYGEALLDADIERIGTVTAVGLDETAFARMGRYRRIQWATTITDTAGRRLLDVVPGRGGTPIVEWFQARSDEWLTRVVWACLDLSGGYRKVFNTVIPHAEHVADPFHVVRLANQALDEVRRRVQNATLGHRGRKTDPLYRCRRLLTMAEERHTNTSNTKLRGLLDAGDPDGEVRDAWFAKECVRDIYTHADSETAAAWITRLGADLNAESVSPETRRLGRTLQRWATPIGNWHRSGLSNAATEGANNLIKRVKRVGFGFRSFRNYRIRILLYAGRPNWDLLTTINPAQIR